MELTPEQFYIPSTGTPMNTEVAIPLVPRATCVCANDAKSHGVNTFGKCDLSHLQNLPWPLYYGLLDVGMPAQGTGTSRTWNEWTYSRWLLWSLPKRPEDSDDARDRMIRNERLGWDHEVGWTRWPYTLSIIRKLIKHAWNFNRHSHSNVSLTWNFKSLHGPLSPLSLYRLWQ